MMLRIIYLSFVAGILSFCSSEAADVIETEELLPNPAAYSSYDLDDAFKSLSKNRFSKRKYGSSSSKLSSPDSLISNRDSSDFYETETEYGGLSSSSDMYASESGYGHSCSSGFVNASAVALLAFLFLLNIVQDIIEKIVAENAAAAAADEGRKKREIDDTMSYMMKLLEQSQSNSLLSDLPSIVIPAMNVVNQITAGRKRRSLKDMDNVEDSVLQTLEFINNGGVDAFFEDLPNTIIPMLTKVLEATDQELPSSCVAQPICEINSKMTSKFGYIGQITSKLLTNVVSGAFALPGSRRKSIHEALEAGRYGRMHKNCIEIANNCTVASNLSRKLP